MLLIGLDTTILNKFSGEISNDQLVWLDNILNNNKDKFTVIVMHHPAITATNADKNNFEKNFVISNAEEFISLIKKYPQVKLVLSGHHHINLTRKINNIIFIESPSIVTYPNCFKLLTVYPDKIQVENKYITYKQIIKKAKKSITTTKYAQNYNPKRPKDVLSLQKGDEFSSEKTLYFNGK